MKDYFVFDKSSGVIRYKAKTVIESLSSIYSDNAEIGFMEAPTNAHPREFYFSQGEIKQRSELSPSVSTSTGQATLSNLPDGTVVRCLGESETSTGTTTIEADEPGTYSIQLDPPVTHKPKTIEVDIP